MAGKIDECILRLSGRPRRLRQEGWRQPFAPRLEGCSASLSQEKNLNPISPDDYRRLENAFDDLLDQEPDRREAWLADFAEERPGDRDLLRGLLEAHRGADDRLNEPLPEAATRLMAESLGDALVGTELGSFNVVEEIGRGGMGVVYRGTRSTGDFDQEVVIKVLRIGVDNDETGPASCRSA